VPMIGKVNDPTLSQKAREGWGTHGVFPVYCGFGSVSGFFLARDRT
jgi:hypothetical protein